VLRALELDVYRRLRRHDAAVLADAIGLKEEAVEQCLEQLSRAGQVRRVRGLWVSTDVLTLDTRPSPQKNRALKRHWAAVGLVRLEAAPLVPGPDERSLFSFNLFAVSHAEFEQIRQLHIDYYERVRSIVADATLGERVVLLNQQLIDLRLTATSG
jgi:hypothetical protein